MQKDDSVFKISMFSLLLFAILGIIFGIVLNSDVIFFDGVYSIVSIGVSFATLQLTRYIRKKDHLNFPFGKEGIEPLVVLIQYTILNSILLYTFIGAIKMILNGGSEINLGMTIIYLVVTTIMLVIFVGILKQKGKNTKSPIVKTEILQWDISVTQSYYVLAGYIVGFLLQVTTSLQIVYYIDPIILIVFVIVTFNQTIPETLIAFKELIGMSTIGNKMTKKIENTLNDIKVEYHIKEYYLRLKKVGKLLVVEVDFLVDENFQHGNVYEQDKIRADIQERLKISQFDLWLSITFTADYRWIE